MGGSISTILYSTARVTARHGATSTANEAFNLDGAEFKIIGMSREWDCREKLLHQCGVQTPLTN
jgi:hypothetical protein